jgi:hypothetical protein
MFEILKKRALHSDKYRVADEEWLMKNNSLISVISEIRELGG